MMKLIAGAMLLTFAGAANAACSGDLVQIRVSKLKAGGSMAGFAEAAKANAAWFAANGLKDERFVVAPVHERVGGDTRPSVTKVMTMHLYGAKAAPKRDAAWDAFVAQYAANATIESTTMACLPKGTIR